MLNTDRVLLSRDGVPQRIEPQVYNALVFLIENQKQVVSREQLLEKVWGHEHVSESTLSSCIKMVRRSVGDSGSRQAVIRTVHGKGYEFIADLQTDKSEEEAPQVKSTRKESSAPLSRLPIPLEPLIGRDQTLREIQVEMHTSRLITLVGPGGVGKTSLAYELARSVEHRYTDGVATLELLRVKDADSTVEALATALGVHNHADKSLFTAILESLRDRSLLLLIDNCEHLIDSVVEIVEPIIASSPKVLILTTSREALAIEGEKVWPIEPLNYELRGLDPTEFDKKYQLSQAPAVALFVLRAKSADPRFELNAKTLAIVTEICRRLDGMPLAIELAASRVRAIGVAELSKRLDQRFRLLKANKRGTDPRHQTLRETVRWSYELLTTEEQELFVELAVFAGGFDLQAMEEICGDDDPDLDFIELISRLVDRSMVTVSQSEDGLLHYELLDTLRVFGRDNLSPEKSLALSQKHALYYSSLADSIESQLQGPEEQHIVSLVKPSFADMRAAHQNNLSENRLDQGIRYVCALREYAMRTMRYEMLAWTGNVLELDGAKEHALYPTARSIQAYLAWVRGDFEFAMSVAYDVVEHEASRELTPSGLAERVLANVLYIKGETETGFETTGRQVKLAEESGNLFRLTHACYMHSVAASSMGDFELAEILANRAAGYAERSGSPTDLSSSLAAKGFVCHHNPQAAIDAFSRASAIAESAGNRWMSTFCQTEVCRLLLETDELQAARIKLAEVVDIWFRAGEWGQQWLTLTGCVVALVKLGNTELAAQAIGAIEERAVLGALPVTESLRVQAFETSDFLKKHFGDEQYQLLVDQGAQFPVTEIVQRTRTALLPNSVSP